MDVLIIFAIIFGVIKLIASTAKKSGQQKNTGTQHTETRTAPTPRQTTDNRAPISPTVHTTVHPHESSLRQPSVFGTEKSASRACPHWPDSPTVNRTRALRRTNHVLHELRKAACPRYADRKHCAHDRCEASRAVCDAPSCS